MPYGSSMIVEALRPKNSKEWSNLCVRIDLGPCVNFEDRIYYIKGNNRTQFNIGYGFYTNSSHLCFSERLPREENELFPPLIVCGNRIGFLKMGQEDKY